MGHHNALWCLTSTSTCVCMCYGGIRLQIWASNNVKVQLLVWPQPVGQTSITPWSICLAREACTVLPISTNSYRDVPLIRTGTWLDSWHMHFCICLRLLKDTVSCNKSSILQYEQILWHKVMLVFPSPRFSPEQLLPQTLSQRVGMLHCDSSIWTRHTDLLMITEQDSLSRTQHSFSDRCLLCHAFNHDFLDFDT